MKMKGLRRRVLACTMTVSMTLALAFPIQAAAQSTDESYFRITPYLWMLGLDGTTAVLGQDTEVDASFSDILDVLNIALSVNMEWNTQSNWFFVLDPMWADLEMDIESIGGTPAGGKVEIELIIADALVGYSINENLGLYAGARYYDQDITIVPNNLPVQPTLGDSWAPPRRPESLRVAR